MPRLRTVLASACTLVLLSAPSAHAALWAPRAFYGAANPFPVSVADFTGDGRPDLLVGSFNEPLQLFAGTQTPGVLGAPKPLRYTAFGQPADFNGDGLPDLGALADTSPERPLELTVALADGKGDFADIQQQTLATTRDPPRGPTVFADFDGDGNADAAVMTRPDGDTQSTLRTALSDGDGTFGATRTQPLAAADHLLGAADLDNDGRDDLITYRAGGVVALLSRGAGFEMAGSPAGQFALEPRSAASGDFDGDGATDIVVRHIGTVQLLLGDGRGGLAAAGSVETGHQPYGELRTADVDGDELDDVVHGHGLGAFSVYRGAVDGTLEPALTSTCGGTFAQCDWPLVGDLNADDKPDVVLRDDNGIGVYLNAGAPRFAFAPTSGLDFGEVAVGEGFYDIVDIDNIGERGFSIADARITGPGAADYEILDSDCPGPPLFMTEFCSYAIGFAPTITGPRGASLIVTSSAPGSPHTIPLNGLGVTSPVPAPTPSQPAAPRSVIELRPTIPATQAPFQGVSVSKPARSALRGKILKLILICPASASGSCTGSLKLKAKTRTLGSARFTIPVGRSRVVAVRLSRAGQKLLATRRKVAVVATVVASDTRRTPVTRTRSFTIQRR